MNALLSMPGIKRDIDTLLFVCIKQWYTIHNTLGTFNLYVYYHLVIQP